MKAFQEVETPKGIGYFIHYDNTECTRCTVDINGVWYHFNINEIKKIKR